MDDVPEAPVSEVDEVPEVAEPVEIEDAPDETLDVDDTGADSSTDEAVETDADISTESQETGTDISTEPQGTSGNHASDTDEGSKGSVEEISDDDKPEDEVQLEDLQPGETYDRNGYTYQLDEMGRPAIISGKLELKDGTRSELQTQIGHMGYETDEGGHLIGTRFDGPSDAFNLVPQDANLNRGEWKSMENEWADAIKEGKDVQVLIEPVYGNDSIRPESFDVVYQVDGEVFQKDFLNQSSKEYSN